MPLHPVHFPAVLAIPLGHEVEVRIYAAEEGLFNKTWVPHPEWPWLLDRPTGIVYGSPWLYQERFTFRPFEVVPDFPMDIRPELREHARMVGIVRTTRIVWLYSPSGRYPQTTLLIEAR